MQRKPWKMLRAKLQTILGTSENRETLSKALKVQLETTCLPNIFIAIILFIHCSRKVSCEVSASFNHFKQDQSTY